MNIIYEPKGPALEYAPLALNIYRGCTHGCRYCFGPRASRQKREEYYSWANPKDNVLERVEKDARQMAEKGDQREILISFIGDPYQPADLGLTRGVIKILIKHDLGFTILTKGGMRAARDFDLLMEYPKASFGQTIVFYKAEDHMKWEPNTADFFDRMKAAKIAHDFGIRTWISMEPVIDPAQPLDIIEYLYPIVDHWKIGKINHHPELEKHVDWLQFRTQLLDLLQDINADFYLKKSLTELT